jgi:predicted amino acid-binding ACT domain protein
MDDSIRLVDYFYIDAADRPGEAARILEALREAGVDLLGFSGFPQGRRAQLDFMPADAAAFRTVARRERWKLTGPKKGFLVQGIDRVGAVAGILGKLGAAGINVTATDAVCAGAGRFGMLLWVKPRDVKRAAKALGVGG